MENLSTQSQTEDLYEWIRQLALNNEVDQALDELAKIDNRSGVLLRLARDLALDLAVALALSLALTLAHAHDQDHDLDHDLALALALALAFALDLAHHRSHSLDFERSMGLVRELDHDLSLARALAFDLNLDLDLDFSDILKVLDQSHHIIQFIVSALSVEERRIETTTVVFRKHPPLTTQALAKCVMPYLGGIIELQQIILEMRAEPFIEPVIQELSYHSTLSVQFTGKLSEAIIALRRILIPWRQQRTKKFAELELAAKRLEVAKAQVELQEYYAASPAENSPDGGGIYHGYNRLTLERAQLEYERMRLVLNKEKIDLAEAMIDGFAPQFPQQERPMVIDRLVKSITLLSDSALEIE